MQKTLAKLRTQVLGVSGRYSSEKTIRELDQVFALLEKEFQSNHVQTQRVMFLLRGIMDAQPGTAKAVNEFLRNPKVLGLLQAGGNYNLR